MFFVALVDRVEGLFEVGLKVCRVFNAGGEADEIVANAEGVTLFGGEAAMGGDGRVEQEGVQVAEGGGGLDELEGVHEGEDLLTPRVFDGERKHAARAFAVGEGLGEGVLRVIGQAGVMDAGDFGMGFQPGSEGEGVFTLLADAEGEGFEAAQGKPGFKRPHTAPNEFVEGIHLFAQFRVGDDDACHHIAVPGQVFGDAVDDHIRAVLEGVAQVGGAEGVVHEEEGVVCVGDLGERGEVGHFEEGVGDGFDIEDGGAMGVDGLPDGVQIEDIYPMHGDAEFGEELVEQGEGRAVDIGRGDEVTPRADARHEQGNMDGGHARGEGVGRFPTFEVRDGGFKGVDGGVVVAGGVDEAGFLVAQDGVEVVGVRVGVADGGVDGGTDGGAFRDWEAFPRVDGAGGEGFVLEMVHVWISSNEGDYIS